MSDLLERAAAAIATIQECRQGLAEAVVEMRSNGDPRLNRCLMLAHAAGFTLDELGQMMGVTRERVRQRISAGIPPAQAAPILLTDDQECRLRQLHSVADGRDPKRKRQTAEYREFLVELVDGGLTKAQLARYLGVTHHAVCQQLQKAQDARTSP